jgi:PAS domain S-box-containing protein
MSWIGILNSNGGTIEPVAHAGLVDGYLEILHSAVTDAHDGEDPIGIALREGRYATCNDIAQDHRETLWREKALALGYKSMAAFPLCLANKAIGVISFYSNELGFFDSKEVQLIEELAMDISFALESLQTEEQRKRAETALRESNDFNELMLQTMPHGMNIVDEQGNILFVNNTMKSLLNTDAIGKHCWTIYKDDKSQCPDCPLHKGIESRDNRIFEVSGVLGGKTFQISYIGMLYRGKRSMLEVFQDITEQKRLQLELLQSHKMQSIGTLAGGIAHDFNNILGIILGYTSLLEKRRSDGEKHSEGIAIINQAVQRGAALVRQILTFARKTDIEFEPFDIVDLIHELISMFRQTFPKIITFTENIEKNIPYLYADRTQIHQALMNLCVNARDAMPNGGSINIDVKVFSLELMHKKFPTADQNSYMCITVSDTGQGMDEAMRLRVFDPFFTTKEKGKGTGMGLSVVYGVVKAHRGYIELESALGQGTTFSLYIPIPIISTQAVKSEQPPESVDIGGTETILIVEDEELLVHLLQLMLESKGYKVYVAQDGLKAIEIYKQHREEIKLVLTDMGLPEMTGMDEFKKLKRIDPNVKIVFASGFFNPDTKSELLQTGAKGFIQKPYEANEILKTIRKVLDQKGS